MSDRDVLIRIADWTSTPGPRERDQGAWSAEQFIEEVLRDSFERARDGGGRLILDLDGVAGYLPSFIEETFGGLSRKHGQDVVERHLTVICNDDAVTLDDAWDHVRNPKPPKRRSR